MGDLQRDPDFESFVRRAREFPIRQFLVDKSLWRNVMNGDRGVPCPACGGRDRFAVNVRKNVFTCRASGAGGGAVALWAHLNGFERLRGRDFIAACSDILNEDPPAAVGEETEAQKMERAERRRAASELNARLAVEAEAKRVNDARNYRERERHRAWKLWREGVAAIGSPVADMLALRGLDCPGDADLRFHGDAPLWSLKGGEPKLVYRGPAMLGALCGPEMVQTKQGLRRRFLGVKVTWLDLADRDGKLRLPDPETGEVLPAKKVIGSWKGGSIYLGCPLRTAPPALDRAQPSDGASGVPQTLICGEGIETVLSARQALEADASWAGRGVTEFRSFDCLGNFAGKARESVQHPHLKTIDALGRERVKKVPGPVPEWPDSMEPVPVLAGTRELIWLLDGDSEAFFTDMAVQRGAARYGRHYPFLTIRLARADAGADFNDMWRAERARAEGVAA